MREGTGGSRRRVAVHAAGGVLLAAAHGPQTDQDDGDNHNDDRDYSVFVHSALLGLDRSAAWKEKSCNRHRKRDCSRLAVQCAERAKTNTSTSQGLSPAPPQIVYGASRQSPWLVGRDAGIRTRDLLHPKQAR